jgi:hypothetical protein
MQDITETNLKRRSWQELSALSSHS